MALIIGSSAGYGLAATLAGLKRAGIRGIIISAREGPTERRTATAGWYRTAATADIARAAGRDLVFLNGDAFSDTVKNQVADLLEQRFGGKLDYLIYWWPRPAHQADTGTTYASVLKPIGQANRTKTLLFDDQGVPEVREVETGPAEGDGVDQTVAVMGGADWERWIDHLAGRDLLGDGFATAALSYIGSPLTAAIYRRHHRRGQGPLGGHRPHPERAARENGGRAGRDLRQRRRRRPVVHRHPRHRAVHRSAARRPWRGHGPAGTPARPPLGPAHRCCPLTLDDEGRVRLDNWELTDDVQAAVAERWEAATTNTIADLADHAWFRTEVQRLYGFSVPGVSYTAAVATDIPWPTHTP